MQVNTEDREFLSQMRDRAPLLVALFFILSMVAGAQPNNPVFVAAWLILAVLGVVSVWLAFPNTYLYGVWLLGIYMFSSFGILAYRSGLLQPGQAVGVLILFEILALYTTYNFILQVRAIRNLYRHRYVPLGIWSLFVVMFFLLSNVSAYSWTNWSFEETALAPYYASEIVLVILVIVIFWHPEKNILEEIEASPTKRRAGLDAASEAIEGELHRQRHESDNETHEITEVTTVCPLCKGKLTMEHRACPSKDCDHEDLVAFCETGEHFVVTCPDCGRVHAYGEPVCPHCGTELDTGLACPACDEVHPITEWPIVAEHHDETFE